jgi:hypothetical protein
MGIDATKVKMERILKSSDRRGVLSVLALTLLSVVCRTQAQPRQPIDPSKWEPLDEVGGITAWFRKLSAEFDRYVSSEKRYQLSRSVERLRKGLYQLEQDALTLRDSIPDKAPTASERDAIRGKVKALLGTVAALSADLRAIGADLRLEDPNEMWRVEERLYYGFRTRAITLTYVERELERNEDEGAPWQAAIVSARLTTGIEAIKDAQRSVVRFQAQLTE